MASKDYWRAQAKGWQQEVETWEENHQILAEHFNRYVDQAEAAIDRLRERVHDAEDLADQWRDRFEGERKHAHEIAAERDALKTAASDRKERGDSEVTNVVVEVEREAEHGVSYDRYPRAFGYGLLLGELVIYDHDGMDIANYPVGTYGCVSSWEQGAGDA